MNALNVLFLNCTLKQSPETCNTEALWHCVETRFTSKGCLPKQVRTVDFNILPGVTLDEGPGDQFPQIFEWIKQADILIVGTPILAGSRSSECQKLIERLLTQFERPDSELTQDDIEYLMGKLNNLAA